MRLIKGNIYVYVSELICADILSKTIEMGVARSSNLESSSWCHISAPEDRRKILIKLDSIPKATRKKFLSKYDADSIQEWAKNEAQRLLGRYIQKDERDLQYFRGLKHENGKRFFTDRECNELSTTAAWLRFLASIPREKRVAQKMGFENKTELLKAAHRQTTQIEKLKGLRKLSSFRRFRDRIAAYSKEGNSCLVSKKYGNSNTKKLTKKAEKLLRQLYSKHNKFAYSQVHEQYRSFVSSVSVCDREAYPEIGLTTVKNYLRRPSVKMICSLERNGLQETKRMFEPSFKRQRPSYPHAMWVMDGTPVELYFQEHGKYWKRMYGFFVIDACSWNMVGYALAESETADVIFEALKMASTSTGYLPDQLQFDNSSAIKSHDMMAWYPSFTRYASSTQVGNAKAKIIEPAFARFNESCLRQYDNYAGANIEAKKLDSKVNAEWLRKNKHAIPDRAGVIAQIEEAISVWNSLHPLEGETKAQELTIERRVDVFWKWRMKNREEKKTYQYRKEGMRIQIRNIKYDFAVYDPADGHLDYEFWREHAGKSFHVKYDPDDMSMIALYEGEYFVSYAEAVKELPMAYADYQDGDGAYVQGAIGKRGMFWGDLDEEKEKDKGEEMTVMEAEGYRKAPFPINGKQKDHFNDALEIIERESTRRPAPKKGLYDAEGDLEIIDYD